MVDTPTVWLASQQANTIDSGPGGDDQYESRLVQLGYGNFVVLWTSNTDAGAGATASNDIIAQVYDALGNKIGDEFNINHFSADQNEDDFDVEATSDGGFVVAHRSTNAGLGKDFIHYAEWSVNLRPAEGSFGPNPYDYEFGSPAVAVNNNGSYWIAYQQSTAGGASAVGKLLNPNGSEITLGIGSTGIGDNGQQLDAAHLNNNNSVFVWRHNGADPALSLRIMNTLGNSLSASFVADTLVNGETDLDPAVAALAGGGFVVAWANTDASDTDIQFQRYLANGVKTGTVATVGSGGNTDSNRTPAVIALSHGDFLVVWDDNEANTISGRRYDANGFFVGNEVTIATPAALNSVAAPALELLQDGRVLVSWTNRATQGLSNVDSDVRFAILDPRDNVLAYGNDDEMLTTRQEATTMDAGGGHDTVFGQAGSDSISGGTGKDNLLGGDGFDTIKGGHDNDTLTGGLNGDVLNGEEANDELRGSNGPDSLLGAVGNDALYGGVGKDTMNGGAGADDFVFDTPIGAAESADVVQAFAVVDDTIKLDNATFTGLAAGVLSAAAFRIGPAQDANDRIIYGPNTGGLFFDSDGNGAGAAQKFAVLNVGLALTNADFIVF